MEKKPGRNDPCPCGSGKKYKNCHLGKEEEQKKTYTAAGKRKFKAKVLHSASVGQEMFANSATTPKGAESGDSVRGALLRFRKTEHDYRPQEGSEETIPFAPASEKVAPSPAQPKEELGETFKPAKEDYRKKEEK